MNFFRAASFLCSLYLVATQLTMIVVEIDEEYDRLEKGYQLQVLKANITYHALVVSSMLYILLPLFICGFISHLVDASLELRSKHQVLLTVGPPEECDSYHDSSYYSLFYFFRSSSSRKQSCQEYYTQLDQTDRYIPNVWQVLVTCITSTIIQPITSLLHMISELPWFLQYTLMMSLVLSCCIWIATRGLNWSFPSPVRQPDLDHGSDWHRITPSKGSAVYSQTKLLNNKLHDSHWIA